MPRLRLADLGLLSVSPARQPRWQGRGNQARPLGLTVGVELLCLSLLPYPAGGLYLGTNVNEAIRRYWGLWMPLLARLPEGEREQYVPPLDVAYAW